MTRPSSTFRWRPDAIPEDMAALIEYGATEADCDVWVGTRRPDGYGVLRVKVPGMTGTSHPIQAHRFIYEVVTGTSIPGTRNGEEVELDHLCRNPSCVNPAHLEPVTKSENLRRRHIARRPR